MAIANPGDVEIDVDGARRIVPGTWRTPEHRLLPEVLEQGRVAIGNMLKPATEQQIRNTLLPLMLTLKIENKLLTEENEREFYSTMVAELVRHLKETPPDILAEACDAHVKESPFFPTVADLFKHIKPAIERRKTQQWRIAQIVAAANRPTRAEPFKPEPEDVRLRATVEHYHKHRESFLGPILRKNAVAAEQRLAEIENRAPEDWALEQAPPSPTAPRDCERCGKNHYDTTRPTVPTCPFKPQKPGPSDMPLERPASPPGAWKAGQPVFTKPMPSATASDEPPMPDEIPEGDGP
jgi:hypothetical protein